MPDDSFLIRYDGDALREHTIEASDLASALIGLSEFIEEGNRIVNSDRASVKLRVKATHPGCFQVVIFVQQGVLDRAIDLFSGHGIAALATLLGILGFSPRDNLLTGVIEYVRRLQGRMPRAITTLPDNILEVEMPDGTKLKTTKDVLEITHSSKARSGLYKMFRPLEKPGIDSFEATEGQQQTTIRVTKSDLPSFAPVEVGDQLLNQNERDTVVSAINVSFRPDNKWKVTEGGESFFMKITDADFLQKVASSEISFSANILWKVHLIQRQYRTKHGALKTEYEVPKIERSDEAEAWLFETENVNRSDVLRDDMIE